MFVKNLAKPKEITAKNKYRNPYSTNNSLAHHDKTLDNETLQATTRSGHNGTGQAKAQTDLMCSMSQARRILNMYESSYEIHVSEFFIRILKNNSYIVLY